MPSTVYLGRAHGTGTSADQIITDTGTLADDQMRASTYGRTTQHLWLRKLGAHLGKYTGTGTNARIAAYAAASDFTPTNRLALVNLFAVNTTMTSATEGFDYEQTINVADVGPSSTKAAFIVSGTRIAIAVENDGPATLAHGMVQRADSHFPAGQDDQFRDKFSVVSPPDPFGSFTPSTQGVCSYWAVCDTNDAPLVPINRTTLNVDTLIPTFEGDFRDLNGAYGTGNGGYDAGDYMKTYRIQVRRQSDAVTFWNPGSFTASSSERTANRFSRAYAGNTLVRGTVYEWRCYVTDYAGASSDWSTWLAFTTSAQGTVTAQTTPSGKQDTLTPGPFTARWTHATGLSMTHARVIINYQGRTYLDSGILDVPDVLSSASPGTLFTIAFATAFPATNMTSGDFTWRILGRDSAANWSNDSAQISFSVDKSPDTPGGLHPVSGTVTTTYPLLTFQMGDDDDTSGTGLTAFVEILDASGALLQTRTASYVSGETWQYQVVAADFASYATYRWRAYGYDGFLYSGGVTSSSSAQRSLEASIIYATGPTVTVTAPTDGGTVSVSTPTLAWTATTQTAWRVRIYEGATLVYRTNAGQWTQTSQQTYAVKPGYLHNGHSYRWELDIQDVNSLTTTTSQSFSVVFTPPADVAGFAITATSVGTDPWATAIRGDWEASTVTNFVAYAVYRDDLTNPLFWLTSPADVAFIDFHPSSGLDYTYTLKVVTEQDQEQLMSTGVSAQARIDISGIVLSSVVEPYTIRAYLTSVSDASHSMTGIETTYKRWGDRAPSTIRGRGRWWETDVHALILSDAIADAAQRRDELEAIALLPTERTENATAQEVSTAGQTYCYRDWRGVKRFVSIPSDGGLTIGDLRFGQADVTLKLREEAFDEGVS